MPPDRKETLPMPKRHKIELSQDAALVAALAGTAMPFSHSAEDQAERWLRALRLHGGVGAALQALGVGEAPLMISPEPAGAPPAGAPPLGDEGVRRVVRRAGECAAERGAALICTADLLFGLFEVYDRLMDRALYMRGASREELVERLATTSSPGLALAGARRCQMRGAGHLLEPAAEVQKVIGTRHDRDQHHRVDQGLDPDDILVWRCDQR